MDATNPDGEYRDPALATRWRRTVVLKRDLFSTVERGYFRAAHGEVDAVMRRVDRVPWWTRPIARHFLKREARALAVAGSIGVAPELLHAAPDALVRRFIDGVALLIARPLGELHRRSSPAIPAVRVGGNTAVAAATQEPVDRLTTRLADQVPEGLHDRPHGAIGEGFLEQADGFVIQAGGASDADDHVHGHIDAGLEAVAQALATVGVASDFQAVAVGLVDNRAVFFEG